MMDNTKEYILMCEKAKKDLLYYPIVGDFCYRKHDITSMDDIAHGAYFEEEIIVIEKDRQYDIPELIPLYRQDQLQEMLQKQMPAGTYQKIPTLVEAFHDYYSEKGYPLYWSMEQLWLAFVMKEKYNKVWNGTDWIPTSQRTESM